MISDELDEWLRNACIFVALMNAMAHITDEQAVWAIDELEELRKARAL